MVGSVQGWENGATGDPWENPPRQLSMSTACEGCRVGDGRDGSGWSSVQIQVTPSLLSSRR